MNLAVNSRSLYQLSYRGVVFARRRLGFGLESIKTLELAVANLVAIHCNIVARGRFDGLIVVILVFEFLQGEPISAFVVLNDVHERPHQHDSATAWFVITVVTMRLQ